MARSGKATRERILDATQDLFFQHGFAATSIDSLLERTGLTKGAFFYHFKSKSELGQALVRRYAARDLDVLETAMQRAEKLSDDALQQLLIFVGLLKEPFENLTEPPPGCLFAAYLYQPREFTPELAEVAKETLLAWRQRLVEKLERVAEQTGAASSIDTSSVADQLLVVLEGSYVLAKGFGDAQIPLRQLEHYRQYLRLLFDARGD
jgi:TetR/AcrR family transcriptional repressor of nem operon